MTRLYSATMADYPRYAIYYAPAPGSDLDRFRRATARLRRLSRARTCPFPDGIRRCRRIGAI